MNHGTWLFGDDPERMLDFLGARATERKLMLFAVACCRRVEALLTDRRSRRALDAAERFAYGEADVDELQEAQAAAHAAWTALPTGVATDRMEALWVAARAASWTACRGDAGVSAPAAAHYAAWANRGGATLCGRSPERAAQAALVRCVFGNPFMPVSLDPAWTAWNDGVVRKLARCIYDERALGRLPLLADALEEAGCDCWEILDHCRGKGPHVRGCWVVDRLLGRE
jgi:hypothetical protein